MGEGGVNTYERGRRISLILFHTKIISQQRVEIQELFLSLYIKKDIQPDAMQSKN